MGIEQTIKEIETKLNKWYIFQSKKKIKEAIRLIRTHGIVAIGRFGKIYVKGFHKFGRYIINYNNKRDWEKYYAEKRDS